MMVGGRSSLSRGVAAFGLHRYEDVSDHFWREVRSGKEEEREKKERRGEEREKKTRTEEERQRGRDEI
jgi:hypothetical protein